MRVLTMAALLAAGLALGAAHADPRPASPTPEADHPFSHLEGRRPVDDTRMREMFDRAVTQVVAEQANGLREAAFVEVRRRRVQRRTPIAPQDLQDLQPAHIPAVELVRVPFS